MRIKNSDKPSNNILFFPYWGKATKTNDFISKELLEQIETDSKYFNSAGQSRRYFIKNDDCNVVYLGEDGSVSLEDIRKFISIVTKIAKSNSFGTINVFLFADEWKCNQEELVVAALDSLMLSNYTYTGFKSKSNNDFNIEDVNFVTKNSISGFDKILTRSSAIHESISLARDLINGPPNYVTVEYMENVCKDISVKSNLDISILKKKDLEKNGMNLLLAVGNGGEYEPRLIELNYIAGDKYPTICLVGKGIVFDTGGINLKPSSALDGMKSDMAGAATVLALVDIASKLKVPVNVTALLPLAENSIDGKSYRPGDVIAGYNKKSVEIKNTDAEGRLILADALSYSDTKNPDLTVDFATLTGSAVVAWGQHITAAFFRSPEIKDEILKASKIRGEHIWEMPLFGEYKKKLKSDIADLSNIGPSRDAGTIMAALFLSNFTANPNWVHFDIAGPAFIDEDSHYYKKGATGILIRTMVDFFENYNKMK